MNRSVFKLKKIYLGKNGYVFFIVLLSILKGFGLDTSRSGYWIFSILGLMIFSVSLLRERCSVLEGQKIIMILLTSALIFYHSRGLAILLLGIMIISLKNIKADDALRVVEPIWIISTIACVMLSFTGITINNVREQFRLIGEVKARNSMGYLSENVFHETVVIGIILYCYNRRMKFNRGIVLAILNGLVFLQTYSSAGLIVGMLAILGFVVIDNIRIRFNSKVIYYFIALGSFLPILITFGSGLLYKEENYFWYFFNQLVTGRIRLNNLYLRSYPITLLGQSFNREIDGFLDNAYCYILLRYGLVAFTFFLIMYILVIKDCIRKKNIKKLYFCFLFFLYAFIEQFFQNCFMNYSLFFFADVIWRSKYLKGEGKYYESGRCKNC